MRFPSLFRSHVAGFALLLTPTLLGGQTPASTWRTQASGSQAELRGLAAPGGTTAWATGARGTVLRTQDGTTWEPRPVPGGEALDFRDVHALDAQRAWILAAGEGPAGRIYGTTDGGAHWSLQFTNTDPKAFLDAFAFWDATHGIALGDVLQGRFQVLTTEDGGATWKPVAAGALPEALPGEGAFAASGTCLVTSGAQDAWFVTGGAKVSRVFHTPDRGRTWTVADTPIPAGAPTVGLFSASFADAHRGLVVGGDYQQKIPLPVTGARTEDGGRTWLPVALDPKGFHSAVLAIPGTTATFLSTGLAGTGLSRDGGRTWTALDPTPFNAVAFADARHGWAVGPKGRIAAYAGPALDETIRAGQDVQGDTYARVSVMFGTDRKATSPGGWFGGDRGEGITYGEVVVSVPFQHKTGEIETPSIWRLETREDPSKHMTLVERKLESREAFLAQVKARLAAAGPQAASFIFVHGYNVGFDYAAQRTAQIAYDLDFRGVPVFYSWPSQASLKGYTTDENNVQWSEANLKRFLSDYAAHTAGKDLYLIAHSMGNRALTGALRQLFTEQPKLKGRFKEIILTAPDIDAEIFKRDIAPVLTQGCKRITLYVSNGDNALLASKKVHGYPRLGDTSDGIVVIPGIDTVDASGLDTSFLEHSYFATTATVLVDIRRVLLEGLRAARRGLEPKLTGTGASYWKLATAPR
ncbi:MAG TPA: alpha/beta hydrolase [Holophagaceae bacterium]|nr:alpha/beta hydrolase [Holophagaceae bacterium]